MLSSRRLIIKGLRPEHFKCGLKDVGDPVCDECGAILINSLASEIVKGRMFCKKCSPWYKQRALEDEALLEEDLKRK